jgi:hypothetical protein
MLLAGTIGAGTIKEYAVRTTFRILSIYMCTYKYIYIYINIYIYTCIHLLLHLIFHKNKLSTVKINVIFIIYTFLFALYCLMSDRH